MSGGSGAPDVSGSSSAYDGLVAIPVAARVSATVTVAMVRRMVLPLGRTDAGGVGCLPAGIGSTSRTGTTLAVGWWPGGEIRQPVAEIFSISAVVEMAGVRGR